MLRVAPLPEIESKGAREAGEGDGEGGPGDERGCASWVAAACCSRNPDVRPTEVAGNSCSRFEVIASGVLLDEFYGDPWLYPFSVKLR